MPNKSRLIYIRWGKGVRRLRVKDYTLYEVVGKVGRFNLYKRSKAVKKAKKVLKKSIKKKSVKRITKKRVPKVRVTKKEKDFIARIKGGVSPQDMKKEVAIEKKMLKEVSLMPRFDREKYIKRINPNKQVVSSGRVYGSFHALDSDKRDIYLDLMKNLIEVKDDRFKNKLYALRRDLLKDGIVIEVDVYGTLHDRNVRRKYFGTLAIVGLMVEEAGFIETDLVGYSGENRNVEITFDRIVRGHGGQKCYWIKNNLAMDTAHITITDVQLRLSYA